MLAIVARWLEFDGVSTNAASETVTSAAPLLSNTEPVSKLPSKQDFGANLSDLSYHPAYSPPTWHTHSIPSQDLPGLLCRTNQALFVEMIERDLCQQVYRSRQRPCWWNAPRI